MSILVTGGLGFIGAHVVKGLIDSGREVVVSALSVKPNSILEGYQGRYQVTSGNVEDKSDAREILDQYDVDRIIHLAAITDNRRCEVSPEKAYSANVGASVNLLEAARRKGIGRLVMASSAAVFSNWEDIHKTIGVNEMPCPKNMYSTHKSCVEQMARLYRETYGMPIVIARLSRVYGPGILPSALEHGGNPVALMLLELLKGKPVLMKTGGDFFADFSYVKDVAVGLIRCCEAEPLPGLIQHIGSGELFSLKNVAKAAGKLFPGQKISIGPTAHPFDANAPMRGAMDITVSGKELGYAPSFTLEEAIKDYIKWLAERINQ